MLLQLVNREEKERNPTDEEQGLKENEEKPDHAEDPTEQRYVIKS